MQNDATFNGQKVISSEQRNEKDNDCFGVDRCVR